MTTKSEVSSRRPGPPGRATGVVVAMSVLVALVAAVLALPTGVATAAGTTATVGNGLTTTDLAAPGMSPASLAAALVGPGVSVSNVTYSGASGQAGLIHLVDPAVVSFNDGVILSSGNIADVVGPNKSDGITGDMAGPADADLNALIEGTQTVYPMTFDAASLEFDFVPTANQVYFTYTFGSDEYLEWVNLFNDVFAFYVNGQNCATVPSGDPVTIDTVNSDVNPALFRDNSYSAPPVNPINIESDGLSVEMICSAPVTAGATNHMKIAIADTSDQILDSVVMIKAGSFGTTPPESCNDSVDNDDDTLVDMDDDSCATSTTPPPVGSSGIGSSNTAPPFTGNEGTPIPLDASALGWVAVPEATSTSWTVTGINGTTGTCDVSPAGPLPVGADGSIAVVEAVCPNEGEYVARVDGWDVEGKSAFDKDVDFFVHNAPPAVAIDTPATASQATVGDTVDLSATVADPGVGDAVTCDIDWGDGTTEPGTLTGDVCTGSHTYLTDGAPVLSVTATDDAGDSSAAAALLTIDPAAETTVTSDADPSVKGQPVTLTATTTLGTMGVMSFYDGSTLLGTRTVVGGSAALTTTKLAVGSHAVTAVYEAGPVATPSVSPVLDQQVDPAATTTTLTSNVNPSVSGQSVVLRTTVLAVAPGSGAPTGTVDLYDNGTLFATRTVSSGVALLTVKPTVGDHTFTATFNGSTSFLGSATAAGLSQHVDPAATTTTLTSSVNPSVSGQPVSLRAAVKPVLPASGVATGTVTFFDNGSVVATKSLSSGVAIATVKPSAGVHVYSAAYGGSAGSLASATTTPVSQVVDVAASKVTLTSAYPTTTLGHSGVLTAAVATVAPGSGTPTGTVAFYDDGTYLGSVALVSGRATLPIASLPRGVHPVTAVYSGSTTNASATSAVLTQTIS